MEPKASGGTVVVFLWIPAHMGIVDYKRVDKLAKQAVKKNNKRDDNPQTLQKNVQG